MSKLIITPGNPYLVLVAKHSYKRHSDKSWYTCYHDKLDSMVRVHWVESDFGFRIIKTEA